MGKKQSLLTVVLAVVAGFIGGGVSSWVLTGRAVSAQPTPEQAKVIRAERFEVADKDGKVRAKFGLGEIGELSLRLDDEGGKPCALLMLVQGTPFLLLSGEEPALVLSGQDGKSRAQLSASDGEPDLRLFKDGKIRVMLELLQGEPDLWLADKNGKRRATLGLADGEPFMWLADEYEKNRTQLSMGKDGEPFLGLFDKDEKTRAGLGIGKDGDPVLGLYDKDEKTRIELSLVQGEPSIELAIKTESPAPRSDTPTLRTSARDQ